MSSKETCKKCRGLGQYQEPDGEDLMLWVPCEDCCPPAFGQAFTDLVTARRDPPRVTHSPNEGDGDRPRLDGRYGGAGGSKAYSFDTHPSLGQSDQPPRDCSVDQNAQPRSHLPRARVELSGTGRFLNVQIRSDIWNAGGSDIRIELPSLLSGSPKVDKVSIWDLQGRKHEIEKPTQGEYAVSRMQLSRYEKKP